MAKITWTSVGKPARGLVSELRTKLTMVATAMKQDRAANTALLQAVTDFLTYFGRSIYTPGGTQALVNTGATVNVDQAAGAGDVNGTATVAGGVITQVRLPSNTNILANSATVAVRNSAVSKSVNGTSVVATGGTLTGVNLPATEALISNNQALTVPVTGTYTTTATLTVAAGVVTGITLS